MDWIHAIVAYHVFRWRYRTRLGDGEMRDYVERLTQSSSFFRREWRRLFEIVDNMEEEELKELILMEIEKFIG